LAAPPEQEFVLKYYRHHTNWGTAIAKVAKKAGVRMWKKAFNNPRSSRTTELDAKGTPQSTMGAVFGNTEKVRKIHYLQFQQQKEFAKLLEMMETDSKKEQNVGDQEHFLADFLAKFNSTIRSLGDNLIDKVDNFSEIDEKIQPEFESFGFDLKSYLETVCNPNLTVEEMLQSAQKFIGKTLEYKNKIEVKIPKTRPGRYLQKLAAVIHIKRLRR
jgi:hypothetical protein